MEHLRPRYDLVCNLSRTPDTRELIKVGNVKKCANNFTNTSERFKGRVRIVRGDGGGHRQHSSFGGRGDVTRTFPGSIASVPTAATCVISRTLLSSHICELNLLHKQNVVF